MEPSIFISIPLLLVPFFFIVKYRNFLVGTITKIKLPKIILALLVSIPLIIFEEHINCGAYECTNVFIPPTLWFLLILELVFFLLVKVIPIKNINYKIIFICFLGVLFELFQGAEHVAFQGLIYTHPFGFAFLTIWVGFSYAFAYFLPILIFKK